MPWGMILEVGLKLISLFIKDKSKKAEARRRFIEFVESRSSSHRSPSNAKDDYERQKKEIKDKESGASDETL